MTTHSVPNPLSILGKKPPVTTFENPLRAFVKNNPLEKYRQTIHDLVSASAEPAFKHYYSHANIKDKDDRCQDMNETIEDIVNHYMKDHPESLKFISEQVSDTIISSCKKKGIMSVQQMSSEMDENRNSIKARLKKLQKTGGGTRKSIRRKSKTRRYRR
jgi:hypothetical protein